MTIRANGGELAIDREASTSRPNNQWVQHAFRAASISVSVNSSLDQAEIIALVELVRSRLLEQSDRLEYAPVNAQQLFPIPEAKP